VSTLTFDVGLRSLHVWREESIADKPEQNDLKIMEKVTLTIRERKQETHPAAFAP
jgi:hypothetical protein